MGTGREPRWGGEDGASRSIPVWGFELCQQTGFEGKFKGHWEATGDTQVSTHPSASTRDRQACSRTPRVGAMRERERAQGRCQG